MELSAMYLTLALKFEMANNSTDALGDMSSEEPYLLSLCGVDIQMVLLCEVLGDSIYRRAPVWESSDRNPIQ
jgi:hypothetical protein